jgi:cell division protein FtsB
MSASLAHALPTSVPEREAPSRYIDIAPSREQRRARPRLAYAMVVVGGLFAVLVSQLLLSIALADGAYEIASLQAQHRELSRDEQILTEQLDVLNSPQSVAARAESLGMVSNESAVYLNLATGGVMGAPVAANATAGSVIGANGSLLVPNALMPEVPDMGGLLAAQASADAAAAAETAAGTGVATTDAASGSVPSYPNGIPAPVTR